MKNLLIILVLTSARLLHNSEFVDPTGTYILKGDVKNNRIVSHSGEIRVKLLDRSRVALCFHINKGYPGYESAAFMDTLPYNDNKATYIPSIDTACTVVFSFTPKAVEILQIYSDPQGCGFARGILVSAVFEKSSDAKPVIQDLSVHG